MDLAALAARYVEPSLWCLDRLDSGYVNGTLPMALFAMQLCRKPLLVSAKLVLRRPLHGFGRGLFGVPYELVVYRAGAVCFGGETLGSEPGLVARPACCSSQVHRERLE